MKIQSKQGFVLIKPTLIFLLVTNLMITSNIVDRFRRDKAVEICVENSGRLEAECQDTINKMPVEYVKGYIRTDLAVPFPVDWKNGQNQGIVYYD